MVKKSVRKSAKNNENTKKQLKNQEKAWNSETEKGLNEIDIEMLNAHNLEFPQSYPQDSKPVALNIHNFQKIPKI